MPAPAHTRKVLILRVFLILLLRKIQFPLCRFRGSRLNNYPTIALYDRRSRPSRKGAQIFCCDYANSLDHPHKLGYTASHKRHGRESFLRIGQGFDAHRLLQGRKLILGGEEIDYPKGLEGHSDADVLTHAVIDAILGAAGLGDIGMHFPDSDPAYKGASSISMLEVVSGKIRTMGFRISNLDATVFAEYPKIGPYREAISDNLARATGIAMNRINVKATTTERLGFTGRGEGIAASAVALLEEIPIHEAQD